MVKLSNAFFCKKVVDGCYPYIYGIQQMKKPLDDKPRPQTLNISIPPELFEYVDDVRKKLRMTRSAFIKELVEYDQKNDIVRKRIGEYASRP